MLLDDIIAILSDHKESLEAALLKTKVLFHQLGHKDLLPWVNSELQGYPDGAELPAYRIVSSQPHGHLTDHAWDYKDQVLPVSHLKAEQKDSVLHSRIYSSISTIEQQVEKYRKESMGLMRKLPPEFIPAFQKGLAPGVNIMNLYCSINMADVEAIVVQVRSRLLDFCLELQGVVGVTTDPKQVQEKIDAVDTPKMFHTNIYGGTVIIGSQNVQVNNQSGDVEDLLKTIAELGYDKKELEDLRHAIASDKAQGTTPDITDGNTGSWFTKALKKARDGAVKVTVDVAASVITKALQQHLGV